MTCTTTCTTSCSNLCSTACTTTTHCSTTETWTTSSDDIDGVEIESMLDIFENANDLSEFTELFLENSWTMFVWFSLF